MTDSRRVNDKLVSILLLCRIPVSMDALLGGDSAMVGRMPTFWMYILIGVAALLFVICIIAVCVRRREFENARFTSQWKKFLYSNTVSW